MTQTFAEKSFDKIASQIASTLQLSEDMGEDAQAVAFGKWMRSWASFAPQNGASNRPYNGCNSMLLGMMMGLKKWEHPFFLTFAGCKKLGGAVLKGEKSLPIFWWNMIPKKNRETGEVEGFFPQLKVFNVFNVAQTTVDPSKCQKANCEGRRIEEIDQMVKDLGVIIEGGDPAYVPSRDVVKMPEIKAFKTEADYYSSLFHELGHWTATTERCNRVGEKKLSYAQEELVAEMTAVFLDAEFGIEGELQHPEYIASWIKGLKNQPRQFFDACRMAQKAANFILQKKFEKEQKEAA